MRRGLTALIVVAALSAAWASTAAAAKLVADYQFNGTLAASLGTAPALTDSNSGNGFALEATPNCQRPVATFPDTSGFFLSTAGLLPPDRYTVIMQFRVGVTTTDYSRLLAFDQHVPVDDDGLYIYNGGNLDIYNSGDATGDHGGKSVIGDNQYVEVAFTRTAAGLDTVYLNGVPEIVYQETDNDGFLDTNTLVLFRDNGGEDRAGALARLRLYDDALAAAEIKTTQGCIAPTACSSEAVTLAGTSGKNTLVGTPGPDVIAGLAGNDKIKGLGGDDILCGGKGKDKLVGGSGKDKLVGSKGLDTCTGNGGKDKGKGCEAGKL